MKNVFAFVLMILGVSADSQENYKTYCNPIDIAYTNMYKSHNDLSYRTGADPAVVEFQEDYCMFVTRSMGYWPSKDLNNWDFIKPQKWHF